MNGVERFISRFHKNTKSDDITEVFTNGCCYWFAHILCTRFKGRIMYDPVVGHFVAKIGGRLYDITGDVTEEYKVIDFEKNSDEKWKRRVTKNCINFTE